MATVLKPLPPQPVARLRLAPRSPFPRPIDGAWWPRSRDLLVELPLLLGALPAAWGQIAGITVNTSMWFSGPGRMLVAGHVVRLHRTEGSHGRHTICLISPGHGRWDLLVVPPEVDAADAEPLMAAAAAATAH
ncbi:DUF5994 family protein [Streptomyces sp. NPDC058371]|jgi:hypothetical protein|uniref:DUF5994 family protein n=1 Tax=Streptomyces sp. NPDC058371 TaxID=3346463 RepID=UPI0036518199